MPTITKMPSPPTRNVGSIIVNCAAFAVAVVFAGGMCLIMS